MKRVFIATKLVGIVSWTIDRAYLAGQVNGHHGRERAWILSTRRAGFLMLKTASKLDREATGETMAHCGWWG